MFWYILIIYVKCSKITFEYFVIPILNICSRRLEPVEICVKNNERGLGALYEILIGVILFYHIDISFSFSYNFLKLLYLRLELVPVSEFVSFADDLHFQQVSWYYNLRRVFNTFVVAFNSFNQLTNLQ